MVKDLSFSNIKRSNQTPITENFEKDIFSDLITGRNYTEIWASH
jgi:hypothetical protein